MFGLEFMAVGLLHLASMSDDKAAAIKKIKCEPTQSLDIKISPTQSSTKYNFSQSIDQLSVIGNGAYSPYGSEHKTSLLGLTTGKQSISLQTLFSTQTYTQLERGCVHIRKITVNMNFDPTIYVVKEHPNGTCEFNQVFKHEKEHVLITQAMLNKYSKILGKHLKKALKGSYSFGPFYEASLSEAQEKLNKKIMAIAESINKKMNIENEKRQNRFDYLGRDKSLSDTCR